MTGGSTEPTFRVVAINLKTRERRVIETGSTERDADALANMAVLYNGLSDEFYTTEPES